MPAAEPNISLFLSERIAAGDFPSAVYLVAERGEIVFADALGHAVVQPRQIAASLRHHLRSRLTHKAADHQSALRSSRRERRNNV